MKPSSAQPPLFGQFSQKPQSPASMSQKSMLLSWQSWLVLQTMRSPAEDPSSSEESSSVLETLLSSFSSLLDPSALELPQAASQFAVPPSTLMKPSSAQPPLFGQFSQKPQSPASMSQKSMLLS